MLRLHIAEKWEPQDYLAALSAVESIYYITLFAHRGWTQDAYETGQRRIYWRPFPLSLPYAEFVVDEARSVADYEERLILSEIRHASPGFMDFEGVGKVAEAMDSSFGRIIEVLTGRRMRKELDERAKVETEIQRENLRSIKIDNARKLLDLYREYPEIGHAENLERALVDQQTKIEILRLEG